MKFLEELYYYDELYSSLRPSSYWKEIRVERERREQCREELFSGLSESQKELFEKFESIYSECNLTEARYSFLIGFRLGARIMEECYAEDN